MRYAYTWISPLTILTCICYCNYKIQYSLKCNNSRDFFIELFFIYKFKINLQCSTQYVYLIYIIFSDLREVFVCAFLKVKVVYLPISRPILHKHEHEHKTWT
jgi:hypothetical protein